VSGVALAISFTKKRGRCSGGSAWVTYRHWGCMKLATEPSRADCLTAKAGARVVLAITLNGELMAQRHAGRFSRSSRKRLRHHLSIAFSAARIAARRGPSTDPRINLGDVWAIQGPSASANGNFDLILDATVLHEPAPTSRVHHAPPQSSKILYLLERSIDVSHLCRRACRPRPSPDSERVGARGSVDLARQIARGPTLLPSPRSPSLWGEPNKPFRR
jgi:hypothetical protein